MASQSYSTLKKLTINDLPLLCNTLNPVASKCFALGLQLGVKYPQICTIENDYRKSKDQLREIISERLKQDLPLTYHDIVTALRSPSVNHPHLARVIESWYTSSDLQQHPSSGPQQENAGSSHMTSVHHSIQEPTQYPSNPISQTHTAKTQPSQIHMYTPFTPCPSFQSYLHHSQIQPHNPLQYPSLYHPSIYPFPQLQHFLPALPFPMPPPSIHQSVSSSDQSSSTPSSPIVASQSSLQCTQPNSVHVSSSILPHTIPHAQPPSIQTGWGTPYGHAPYMYPPYHMSPHQAAHHTMLSTPPVSAPPSRPLQEGVVDGQWDSETRTYHTQLQRQSESSGLGSSPPPTKRPHFEPHPHRVRPNTEPLSTYHQSQTSSSGLVSLPAKTTGVKSPMDQYIDYVKDTYRQSVIEKDPSVLKWPPTPSEVFISLACIDRRTIVRKEEADEYTRAMIEDGNIDVILNKKKEIDFSDIAVGLPATNSSERVILVEGAPGVGKSTFAWEFCRRWERGEIAEQYQLVLLLRLRDERMSTAENLRDLIYHPDTEKNISHAIKCELVDSHGINTLIILEGFDELSDSQRKERSIFLQLILGQLLMHATIMITSRPWATGEIMRRIEHRIFQHIKVLGFTEENVVKYVRSVFTGESKNTASAIDQSVGGPDEVSEEAKKNIDDVMAYICKYPQIKACMYIPLNAAIVVSIYQDSKKGNCILPKTLTELYYALTQILLLRYLYGHADYKEQKWNIDCFEKDLPDEVYKQLLTICKVAYDGICRKGRKRVQLIFSDSDLGGCETLGFMQSVAEVYVMHGQKMSHNFLHLTVQEFLAAFLISTKSPAEQLKEFQRHKDGRLRVVLRFLAGLTKLNEVTPDELRSLLGEPTVEQSDEHQTPYCNPMRRVSAHHTNWLFEAQNSELLQSFFHNHTASFTFTRAMLPLEYYSVGYCIAHSHSKWSLTFYENPEEEKVCMLLKGADTGDLQQCSVALKTYTEAIKSMSSENLNLLLTKFSGCVEELYLRVMTPLSLPHLSALRILELCLGGKSDVCDFSLPVLESLTVIGTAQNSINPSTKKDLCKLLSSSSSIVHLHFKSKVSSQSMEEIFQSVCDNIALLLKSLDIDCKCTFTTTATRSLVQFITRSTTLQYLKIHINSFADFDTFAKGLSDNVALPLKSLDIDCKCTFTTTATRSLVQFITRSTTLQYIRICHVTFIAQGLIELTEAIHHCSRLQEKRLEKLTFCVECSEDVVNLRHMIKDHPDMLKSITDWDGLTNVSPNVPPSLMQLNEERKASIVRLGLGCSQDRFLSLVGISDAGAVALAQALHYNSTLEKLDIDCKYAFTRSLVQLISRSTTLQYLKIHIHTLEDVNIFAKGLSDNIALPLKSLDIDCKCTFTTTATRSLVHFITRNAILQYLKIHIDSFEDVNIFTKGLNDNIALKSMDIDCKCTFTTTATRSLVQFITRSTTLQYIRICHVTFSAQGFIELTEAIHHCSRLQEKKLKKLAFCVECSEDIVNLRHMIKDHPDMQEIINWNEVVAILLSSIEANKMTDSTLSLAFECGHIKSLYLGSMNISDGGALALAQALHHNSTLKELYLSNNSISDGGAIALAQALHHNSTLEWLNLSGNDAIGKVGIHQLVQALTVNTSITKKDWECVGGLTLPRGRKEYATQCTQYNTVKDRIEFW